MLFIESETEKYHGEGPEALLQPHRGTKGGQGWASEAWGCSPADNLPLLAYAPQQMTVFPTTLWASSSTAFDLMWQSLTSSSRCLLPSRSSEGGP